MSDKNNNRKLEPMNRAILMSTALACSIITAFACEHAPKFVGSCGTGSAATCTRGCVSVICSTAKETCSGGSNYYLCTPQDYTTSCTKYQLSKFEGYNEYGMYFCYCGGGTPIGSVPAACTRVVASMGPGCL